MEERSRASRRANDAVPPRRIRAIYTKGLDATEAVRIPGSARRAIGVGFAALLVAFWPTLLSFPPMWLEFREHGFVIAALVGWLIWRDRGRFASAAEQGGLLDLSPVLALMSAVWLAALLMEVQLIHQAAFVGILAAWAIVVCGPGALPPVTSITLTSLLGLPILDEATPILQRMTTIASGGIARAMGITATVGYDTVTIDDGTFLVARGCSGLNFLSVGLTLGVTYAHLFTRRWQTKVAILAVAGTCAILANWLRVALLIWIGDVIGMDTQLLRDHMWQGWVIFTVLLFPSYLVIRRLERWEARVLAAEAATGVKVASAGTEPWAADSDAWRRAPDVDAVSATRRSVGVADGVPAERSEGDMARRVAIASVMAAFGPLLFTFVGLIPRGAELDRDPSVFEATTGSWAPSDPDGSWTPDFRGVDDRSTWTLQHAGLRLEATRLYYVDQTQGGELVQYANRLVHDSLMVTDRLAGPVGPRRRLVNEAIVRGPAGPKVVWYWYRVAGMDTPFDAKAKLLEVVAFFRRSPASELVVVSAPCGPDDCFEAASTLRTVLGGPPIQREGG